VPDAVLTCGDRVEGALGLPTFEAREDLVLGQIRFDGLKGEARRARKRPRAVARRYERGWGAVKILAGVRAGKRTTVAVARASRPFVGFVYGPFTGSRGPRDRIGETEHVVEFRACPRDEPRRDGKGAVGRRTWFAGGLIVAQARCLHLVTKTPGAPARRYALAYGVPAKSC
jgi:hypothetical protein